jgi:hypothetical protein
MVIVICSIYGDVENLLPHFLKHYRNWGVDKFAFSVYRGPANPSWNRIQSIGANYPIDLYARGGEQLDVGLEGNFKNEIRQTLGPDDWYVPTDLDEFHRVPPWLKNVNDLLKVMNEEGADYVQSGFVDCIRPDGTVPMTIDPNISIWEQFPHRCHISDDIVKAWCEKVAIAKSKVDIFGGHHEPIGPSRYKKFHKRGHTFHFKWFGPLYEKEKEKYKTYTAQGRKWVGEQKNLLDWLDTHDGKLL